MLHLTKPKVVGLFRNWLLLLLVLLIPIVGLWPELAQAQSATPIPTTQTSRALVVTVQNEKGQPLAGLGCEVLSLDWGRVVGQPYEVIAKGKTNPLGQVGFNLADWRRVGNYYLKVTTPQDQWASLPLDLTPGQSYTLRLVLTNKPGSNELQLTEVGKEFSAATAGSNAVQAIPQATFLAQVVAQGRTRTVSDLVSPASSTTQGTGQTPALTNTSNTGEVRPGPTTVTPTTKGSLGEAVVLAVVGVISLLAFVWYRRQIYWLLGLPGGQPPAFKQRTGANSTTRRRSKAEEPKSHPAQGQQK
jgi:hypothetical protein